MKQSHRLPLSRAAWRTNRDGDFRGAEFRRPPDGTTQRNADGGEKFRRRGDSEARSRGRRKSSGMHYMGIPPITPNVPEQSTPTPPLFFRGARGKKVATSDLSEFRHDVQDDHREKPKTRSNWSTSPSRSASWCGRAA